MGCRGRQYEVRTEGGGWFETRRPGYCGTFSKTSAVVSGRNPLAQDADLDYACAPSPRQIERDRERERACERERERERERGRESLTEEEGPLPPLPTLLAYPLHPCTLSPCALYEKPRNPDFSAQTLMGSPRDQGLVFL